LTTRDNFISSSLHTIVMDTIVQKLKPYMRHQDNAILIAKQAYRLCRGTDVKVSDVLRTIAAGQDGISGTKDDLISHATLQKLLLLVESDLLTDLIKTVRTTALRLPCFS